MTDRDSVINGLNEIMHYNGEQMFYNDIFIRGIADNALTMLKEQEPKPVVAEKRRILLDDSYDDAKYFEDTFYHCPSCDRVLSRTHMKKDIRFCENCGQAVKWNDID